MKTRVAMAVATLVVGQLGCKGAAGVQGPAGPAVSALLDTADMTFEDEPSVESAVYSWKDSTADFADCLIESRNRRLGCRATATFDGKALKLAGFVPVS